MGLGDTKKVSPPSRSETVKASRGIVGMEVFNRELSPSHCIFEINEFSLKVAGQVETYQSEIFDSGDCKWSLSLYPSGNKKRGGKDHISLYLNIEETDKFPSGWEVFIDYKLFVLDQIDDSYLTVQDAQGAVRRFHERKKQWGFAQLLSLETLQDHSNGYLLDDTCIFGAEVFVLKAITGKSKSSPTTSKLHSDSNNNEKSSSFTPNDQADRNDKEKSSSSTPDAQADGNDKEKSSSSINDDQVDGNDNEKSSSSKMDDQADGNDKEKSSSSIPDDQAVGNDKEKSSSSTPDVPINGSEVVIAPNLPFKAEDSGLVVYKVDYPPAHYILELHNFSLLRGTIHCTDWFEHGGYNWSLTLHHNGNKEDGGEGHISLYLKLEDQNTLRSGWEVFVNCKFFIQDQNKASTYLTIQDAAELGGSFKRYHVYKNEWGIAKLISLETFKQSSNGYLVNDHCVFGVEIFVLKATEKKGILTVGQTLYSPNKINFKFECFSALDKDRYESAKIKAYGGYKWSLIVYPRNGVSISLNLDGYTKLPHNTRVCTKFTLRILNQLHGTHKETTHAWHIRAYGSELNSSVSSYLLAPPELYKPGNGYLVDDILIAQVEFHD